jgi:hypothetical protein
MLRIVGGMPRVMNNPPPMAASAVLTDSGDQGHISVTPKSPPLGAPQPQSHPGLGTAQKVVKGKASRSQGRAREN